MTALEARRRLLMMPHGIDTSPKVIGYNVRYLPNGSTSAINGACITDVYSYSVSTISQDRYILSYGLTSTQLLYKDGQQKDYWNLVSSDSEYRSVILGYGTNQIKFTLEMDKIDDSYVIRQYTGEILFAGKNSIYYGHKNISELE